MVLKMEHGDLIQIDWHLTYNCNLNCVHCGVVRYRDKEFLKYYYPRNGVISDLRKEDLEPLVTILKEDTSHKFVIHFSPNNGESTIHPDFVKIWNLLSSLKSVHSMGITTNGVTLYKILPKMEIEKLRNAIFSLDGNEGAHDRIRGKGTFRRTYKSIQKIDEIKQDDDLFYLQVNFVINKLNADSLKELPLLLAELNSKNIIINVLPLGTNEGNAKVNKDILDIDEKMIIKSIMNAYQKLRVVNLKRRNQGLLPIKLRPLGFTSRQLLRIVKEIESVNFSDFIVSYNGWKNSCSVYTRKKIYVDPFGNLFPCGVFASPEVLVKFYSSKGYINVPNIKDGFPSVGGILDSKFFILARKWINEIYESIPCNSCPLKNSCTICPVYSSIWGVPCER